MEVFCLQDKDVERPVKKQVVDLRDAAVALKAEVVNDRRIPGPFEMEIE